jgi:ribosomal protein S18 acetylase RimI-like enzyme
MTTTIRKAKPDDALACARLFLMATHGIAEATYRDLIPGQKTEHIISERRVRPDGRTTSYTNWRLAEDRSGSVTGGINFFPLDSKAGFVPEQLLTEERLKVLEPLSDLDPKAVGTFYINAIAVFPEHRHGGIARDLLTVAFDEAQRAGLTAVTLYTFEEDSRLVEYYCRFGFIVAARSRPLPPHECLSNSGKIVLMSRPVLPGTTTLI